MSWLQLALLAALMAVALSAIMTVAWEVQRTTGSLAPSGADQSSGARQIKSDPANRGQICEAGFWSLSRHPNYFFEWLCWLAYPVIAIDLSPANSLGWISLLASACMYWVLVHVSGIPPLEAHMLRTRGDPFP